MIELKVVNGKVTEDKKVIQFPRHWTHSYEDRVVKFIAQPYITSIYVAGSFESGRNALQSAVDYKNLKKFIKALEKNKDVTDIVYQDLNDYLSPEDLKLALS